MNIDIASSSLKFLSSWSNGSLSDDLKQIRDCWFLLVIICTALVAVGAFLEEAEHWLSVGKPKWDMRRGILDPIIVPNPWVERREKLIRIGWILLLVGIIGEGVFEALTANADSRLESFDETLLQIAEEQAGKASDSAKVAHQEADDVAIEAKDIEKRLDKASSLINGFENKISAQGPRAKALAKIGPELTKKLNKFKGQRVKLFLCGQSDAASQEMVNVWQFIHSLLGTETVAGLKEAEWVIVSPNINFTQGCGAARELGLGISVYVSKLAPQRTLEAAEVLASGITKALPLSSDKTLSLIGPDSLTSGRRVPKDAPWRIVASDQDLITVMIGDHP